MAYFHIEKSKLCTLSYQLQEFIELYENCLKTDGEAIEARLMSSWVGSDSNEFINKWSEMFGIGSDSQHFVDLMYRYKEKIDCAINAYESAQRTSNDAAENACMFSKI